MEEVEALEVAAAAAAAEVAVVVEAVLVAVGAMIASMNNVWSDVTYDLEIE